MARRKPSACAKRPLPQCRALSFACSVVRRGGTPHHCRILPSARKRERERERRSRARASGKRKVLSAVRKVASPCSTLSLRQRKRTCFMAASTLLFGRTSCLSLARNEDVRRFVRRSMADAPRGDERDEACPPIPKQVRQFYAELSLPHLFREGTHLLTDMDCAPRNACAEVVGTDGGKASRFLVALLWAAGLPAALSVRTRVPFSSLSQTASSALRSPRADGTTHQVVELWTESGVRFQRMLVALTLLHEAVHGEGFALEGVLLDVYDEEWTVGHTVSLFPCYHGGTLRWTHCNSWGEDCTHNLAKGFFELAKKGFVKVLHISLLVQRGEGA